MPDPIQSVPRTVQSAKTVELAIVSYTDADGVERTQLCVMGDKTVLILDSKGIGISNRAEPSGVAAPWLTAEIFKVMGRSTK